jgi:hypothetical protein
MKRYLSIMFLSPMIAHAGTSSGDRDVLDIGCHKNDHTCFVTVSGDPVGPAACSSRSIRWNVENDANGKVALTHLTTAFAAGKKVFFRVNDTCYRYQTNFPTFDWWQVR